MAKLSQSAPLLVHTHYALDSEDLPFWMGLAQSSGDPILELGCGTGRVLLQLAQAGYTTVGLDNNWAMLAFLREITPPDTSQRVSLVQADLAAFHFSCHFPLILLPCNTLSTIRSAARKRLFACVAENLVSGGRFAASVPNPEWLADLSVAGEEEVEETIIHPESGNPVQISSSWEREAGYIRLRWHYDHMLPDGHVERMTLETFHDLAQFNEYQTELENAGLVIEKAYGNFDYSDYTAESPNLILVSCKPG